MCVTVVAYPLQFENCIWRQWKELEWKEEEEALVITMIDEIAPII
jgi:hypothetical protein